MVWMVIDRGVSLGFVSASSVVEPPSVRTRLAARDVTRALAHEPARGARLFPSTTSS